MKQLNCQLVTFLYINKLIKRKQKKVVNILDISTRHSTNTTRNSIINLVFASTNLANKIAN